MVQSQSEEREARTRNAWLNSARNWATRRHEKTSIYLRSNIIRKEAHESYKRLGYSLIKTQYAFRKKV